MKEGQRKGKGARAMAIEALLIAAVYFEMRLPYDPRLDDIADVRISKYDSREPLKEKA